MFKLKPDPDQKTAAAIALFRAGDSDYLIGYLRSGDELTPEIRSFVAEILEGKIKRKRGPKNRPKPGYTIAHIAPKIAQELKIKERYAWHKANADALEEADAHRAAVEATAKELGIKESAVDKTIYPRMRTASRKLRAK